MAEATGLRNNALPYPVYGAPWAIAEPIFDSTGALVTGAAGLDSEISKNGDTAADCTNEATEIATSTGTYYLLLTGTEMTCDVAVIRIKTSTTDAKTTPRTLMPRKLVSARTGTSASAGSSTSTIVLDSGASDQDDFYNGMLCIALIDSNLEARVVSDYVGSTKTATVVPDWNVAPDNNDTFDLKLTEGWQIQQANLTQIAGALVSAAAAQLGVNVVNFGGSAGTFASGIPETKVASIAANAITATAINADAITDAKVASDVTIASVTGAVGSVTGAVGSVTGAVGSVTGAVGSVTGAVGSVTGAVGSVAAGGITAASFAADAITAAKLHADVTTELQAGLATAANLATVAGYIDTEVASILAAVDTEVAAIKAVTDLLPDAGALTSLATAAALATVDDFLDTEVAAIKAKTDNLPSDPADASVVAGLIAAVEAKVDIIDGNVDDIEALLALMDGDLDAVKAVTDLLVAAQAEPTGVPAANATPLGKLAFLFMGFRNRIDVTATKKQYYDDGGAVEFEKDLSDDGTTYSESELNAP